MGWCQLAMLKVGLHCFSCAFFIIILRFLDTSEFWSWVEPLETIKPHDTTELSRLNRG